MSRQLRNRDAALRSRERKKMYVKDLEMKSRYLEGECRRLGRLLQCCFAENQALRLSLQNQPPFGCGASVAKQESAVLLLGTAHLTIFPFLSVILFILCLCTILVSLIAKFSSLIEKKSFLCATWVVLSARLEKIT